MGYFMVDIEKEQASFRDSGGFVFWHRENLYRQVNISYKEEFDAYTDSGLHQALVERGYLVEHQEVSLEGVHGENTYKVLKPQLIPFISYPYEWSFSQLQDAAILTLDIQLLALQYGFTLKDASAFNVQFYQGRPIFIDTLSFCRYSAGPWVAYRQFCQHFLAPLLLKISCDYRLGRLAQLYIDGVPLDLASRLLPWHSWFRFNAVSHIHLHAKLQGYYGDSGERGKQRVARVESQMSAARVKALISSLKNDIGKLSWQPKKTQWAHYYDNTNYGVAAMQGKYDLVERYLEQGRRGLSSLADIGANSGRFSRLAANYADLVVSLDIDEAAVEQHYLKVKANKDKGILPIVLDLFNPSPAIGWSNTERRSFIQRGRFETVIALALIHHLAITNNVPLTKIIALFHSLVLDCLIIEFVPKEDSQVQRLLATREDIFTDYHQAGFERALAGRFDIIHRDNVPHSTRTLYCLSRVSSATCSNTEPVS